MALWNSVRGMRRPSRSLCYRPFLWILEGRTLPGFLAPVSYPIQGDPEALAVGDFNGDGVPDVAVLNLDPGTVSVLLGNGDGTFQPAVNYAVGTKAGSLSVAVGDFNGDGNLDLVVANGITFGQAPSVSVLLGNGDGTFQPAVTYDAGRFPASVAVGDFNGDGILDLAVADSQTGPNVAVLLGNGDGTFQPPVFFDAGAGSAPRSVAVADFNGDGILDLVVANQIGVGSVSVLLGNGDGNFQPGVRHDFTGAYSVFVAVGDFNGDGVPDLAVTNNVSGNVSVLLGNGDGTFRDAVSYPVGQIAESVAIGDFNGDGVPDLAVETFGGASVRLGNGDGTFGPAVLYSSGQQANRAVAVGDFNGDGFLDLAEATADDLAILLNDGIWDPGPGGAPGRQPPTRPAMGRAAAVRSPALPGDVARMAPTVDLAVSRSGVSVYGTDPALPSWPQLGGYQARMDDYFTSPADRTTSRGVLPLDSTTVTGQGGGDTMNGQSALALIDRDGQDNIMGFDPNSISGGFHP